jgi:hypothetical protein
MHPSKRLGGELLASLQGFLAKHLLDSGAVREGV